MRVLLFLSCLVVALPSAAGNLENFAPCTKSNDCKSKQCFEKRCQPSMSWNGHGPDGSYCENDGNCVSRNCNSRRCEPKKEKEKPPAGGATRPPPSGGGAAPPKRPEPAPAIVLDACGKDLRATVFTDDDPAFARENDQLCAELCARFGSDTISKAKALMAAGYGVGFSDTCRELEGKSDAEIACGKKAFDALPSDARDVPFKIPVSCSGTQTKADVDRCVKDLATVKVGAGPAKKLCTTYDAETLAKAKRIAAAGYPHDFATLCRNVDHRSDEELACAKRYLDALFPDDPNGYEFSVPEECNAPVKKR